MNDHRSSWRQKVLARHGETVVSRTDDTVPDLDAIGWERVERRQSLEVAQTFDPAASLAEELLVRLVGQNAFSPGLRLEWEGLLRPLQEAVAAINEKAELELSSFSKGSSVLHFRAVQREPVESLGGEPEAPLRETPLAAPIRAFIDVVDAVENELDVRAWSASRVLSELQKFSGELKRLDLQADFRFYARSGDVRGAQLSKRGMDYMAGLAEPHESEKPIAIRGRVTELRESGHAKVKAGIARNATAYDVLVEAGALTSMRLVLGQNVHWRVNEVTTQDKLGRVTSVQFEFLGDLGAEEHPVLNSGSDEWPSISIS